MKLAVAQIGIEAGNVQHNIAVHLSVAKQAAQAGVDYLVFPELSLTGYELAMADALAFHPDDTRLAPLIAAARSYQITLVVGAPWRDDNRLVIGALIISPKGQLDCYAKIHLHPGEDSFFCPGEQHSVVPAAGERVANGICADTNHAEHFAACVNKGASVYAAGVLITDNGYGTDTAVLASYAANTQVLIAMANHASPTGEWTPAGKSAIWYRNQCIARASDTEFALIIAEHLKGIWCAQVITLDA